MTENPKSGAEINTEENIVCFPLGLIGFETMKDYRIFGSETEKDLYWLQPIDDQEIEFAVTPLSTFHINYVINLNNEEENLIEYQDGDVLTVLVTLSKKSETSL